MPEVVEVKKYADFIKLHLLNKRVNEIKILAGRYKKHGPFKGYTKLTKLLPMTVKKIGTKGKLIWIEFNRDIILSITLGLSGGFVFVSEKDKKPSFPKIFSPTKDRVDTGEKYDITKFKKHASKHLNISFKISTGTLYFYDALSYGTISVYDTREDFEKKLDTLGPDIMNPKTTFQTFKDKILQEKNLDKYIGNVLVNQKIVSGIGNYLRSDILWLARISPFKLVKDLTNSQLKKIFEVARHLIWSDYNKKKGIKLGLINKKYKAPSDYGLIFLVYQQDYDPLGNKVTRDELYEGSQKRTIHYVKSLQK